MIIVDSSVLVDLLTGPERSELPLRAMVEREERMGVPTVVLYEWLRGPRTASELALQEALFPSEECLPFGPTEATEAARIYRAVSRPRSREVDLAIAAHAVVLGAPLWTLNRTDFQDVPGLELAEIAS